MLKLSNETKEDWIYLSKLKDSIERSILDGLVKRLGKAKVSDIDVKVNFVNGKISIDVSIEERPNKVETHKEFMNISSYKDFMSPEIEPDTDKALKEVIDKVLNKLPDLEAEAE